jgi:DNA-binding transcriptional MerR regulator
MQITLYDLSTTANLTALQPTLILHYCKIGLVAPVEQGDQEEYFFDDESVYLLRQIEFLRQKRGINLDGIAIIMELMREITELRTELKFQREHLPT